MKGLNTIRSISFQDDSLSQLDELGSDWNEMNSRIDTFYLILFLGLRGLLLAAPEEEIVRYRANEQPQLEFEIEPKRDPVFPASLKSRGVMEGSATFAIYINQFGELEDYLLLEADHVDFAKAVERVIPKWNYSVPHVDGQIASVTSRIKVNFKRGRGVVYETIGYTSLFPSFQDQLQQKDSYRVYTLDELDSIPIPVHIEKPNFHNDLLEERELVNAVFQFYIDTEGNVRIPTLREADDRIDERLLVIAQEALLQWKFEPPMRNRHPVVAKAAQPFRLKRSELTSVSR